MNRFLHLQSCSRGWARMLIKSFPHYHHPPIRSDHLNTPLALHCQPFKHYKLLWKSSHTESTDMRVSLIMKPDVRKAKQKCFYYLREIENAMIIVLAGVLQGQFLRKVARLSTQQSECGEKLEAIKLMDCAIYAYTSYTGSYFLFSEQNWWKIFIYR